MRSPFDAGDVGQNIERRLEFEDQPLAAALDLLAPRSHGPVVGHGRGHDDDRRRAQVRHHGAVHLLGAAHGDSLDVRRRFERRGAAHQHHASAAARGGVGQRVAHLARRAIGQIANRVEVFARGAGGDQHGLAREVVANAKHCLNRAGDGFDVPPAAPRRSCRRRDSLRRARRRGRRARAASRYFPAWPDAPTC